MQRPASGRSDTLDAPFAFNPPPGKPSANKEESGRGMCRIGTSAPPGDGLEELGYAVRGGQDVVWASTSHKRARPRVLIVDDVPSNVALIRALLNDMPCELVSAASGAEALTILDQQEFALMLVDVQMPTMDGFELAAHVRSNLMTRDTPIVFLTAGDVNSEVVAQAYALGAIDFLFKPVERCALRGKTRAILELYVQRQELAATRDALEHSNAALRGACQQLTLMQNQLIQSAKMASMGTFIAGMAHEINSPLAYVMAHLSTVERLLGSPASEDGGRVKDRLRAMAGGLERIRALVLELHMCASNDGAHYANVHVAEHIGFAVEDIRSRIAGRIELVAHFGPPDCICCNPLLLTQGVPNLVVNAIAAIAHGGTVSIAGQAEASDYVIRVVDNGSGIPASIRHRVMEPFFTTRGIGQGKGLGLAITYALVADHGGTLELRDVPAGGTEAIIRIPMRNLTENGRPPSPVAAR